MNTLALRNRAKLLAAGILVLSGASAFAQRAVGSFDETLDVGSAVELDVSTGSGSIEVRPGSGGSARIVGRITVWNRRLDDSEAQVLVDRIEADPPIELNGNRLTVGRLEDSDLRQVSISYEIEVPSDASVQSHSGSGAQTIVGVKGPVESTSGSGGVTLTDIGGDVEARAGSGAIRANGVAGAFRASAGSGSVTLVQTAPGDVSVSTGSGSSELRGVDGGLSARAGSGSITVEGRMGGPWEIQTGSGSVRLRLPADAAFDLDAEAHSGGIDTDHPVTVRSAGSRGRLSGQVGGGGPLLRVRTGSGSIRIE